MTHPTDEELDALVSGLSEVKGGKLSFTNMPNHLLLASADAIAALRAQLAEVRAALDNANKIMDDWTTLHRVIADIRDASGIGSRLMLSELAHEVGKRIAEANARADLAEAALAAQIEADAGIADMLVKSAEAAMQLATDDDHSVKVGVASQKAMAQRISALIRSQPHDRTAKVAEVVLAFENVDSQLDDEGEFTERSWEQLRAAIDRVKGGEA